jgi:hypothetical protein
MSLRPNFKRYYILPSAPDRELFPKNWLILSSRQFLSFVSDQIASDWSLCARVEEQIEDRGLWLSAIRVRVAFAEEKQQAPLLVTKLSWCWWFLEKSCKISPREKACAPSIQLPTSKKINIRQISVILCINLEIKRKFSRGITSLTPTV